VSELISQIAQRTGIGEDKARLATQTVISFLKTKFPSMANELDRLIEDGDVSKPASGTDRVRESVKGIFGKKTA
jgi:hypothetical protein